MHVIFVDRSAQTFYHFPDHSHPYWEVMLTTKGCGYTMANRSRYSFYPGKFCVFLRTRYTALIQKKAFAMPVFPSMIHF